MPTDFERIRRWEKREWPIQARLRGCSAQPAMKPLLTQTQPVDQLKVRRGLMGFQIIQQAAATADHHQQSAASRVILHMAFQMIRELTNPMAEHGDLHFRRTGIRGSSLVLVNHLGLTLFRDRHNLNPFMVTGAGALPNSVTGQTLFSAFDLILSSASLAMPAKDAMLRGWEGVIYAPLRLIG